MELLKVAGQVILDLAFCVLVGWCGLRVYEWFTGGGN